MAVPAYFLAAAAVPATLPAWWRVISSIVYFASVALVVGGTVTYLGVVDPVLRDRTTEPGSAAVLRERVTRWLAGSGALLAVGGYLMLATRLARAKSGPAFGEAVLPSRLWGYLTSSGLPAAGPWVCLQNALYLVTVLTLLMLFTRRGARQVRVHAAVAAVTTTVGAAVTSIPTSAGVDDVVNGVLDALHILAGCTWLGGVVTLTALVRRSRGRMGQDAGAVWARLWRRFSTVALAAVGTIITSGSWLAWRHVGAPGQLLSTTYGRFLLVKLCLVTGVLVAGAYNQLVLTPRIARAHSEGDDRTGLVLAVRRFPLVTAVEGVLGLGILTVVPFLSGSARAQAGAGAASSVDIEVVMAGLLLMASLAVTLYASHRVSAVLGRRTVLTDWGGSAGSAG